MILEHAKQNTHLMQARLSRAVTAVELYCTFTSLISALKQLEE